MYELQIASGPSSAIGVLPGAIIFAPANKAIAGIKTNQAKTLPLNKQEEILLPQMYPTQARGDATLKVREEGARYERIVCSGGDGTLDEVVTGMREADLEIPLGYIPAGSTNDFARTLGIGNDMVKAAEIAVGDHIFACDVGQFEDDTFIYIAGFGLFTEVAYVDRG